MSNIPPAWELNLTNRRFSVFSQKDKSEIKIKLLKVDQECKTKNNATFPWQKFRLPGESIPLLYRVSLNPNPDVAPPTLSGSVEIIFRSSARGQYIALHGEGFQIRSLAMFQCGEFDEDCFSDLDSQDDQAEVWNFNF